MDLVIEAFTKKYATFSGRAQRKELWLCYLVVILGSLITYRFDVRLGTLNEDVGVIGLVFFFAATVPWLAVGVRRLHDTNMSGWWYLVALIPIVGGIALICFWCFKGDEGENRFGANPLTKLE